MDVKKYLWAEYAKAGDLAKLYSAVHTGRPEGFHLDTKGNKKYGSKAPIKSPKYKEGKIDNKLMAHLGALKVNILASLYDVVNDPMDEIDYKFGDLKYFDPIPKKVFYSKYQDGQFPVKEEVVTPDMLYHSPNVDIIYEK